MGVRGLAAASLVAASALLLGMAVPKQQPPVAPPPAAPVVPKPAAIWMPSPHQDDRPEGMAIDTLVIHDTETPGVRQARTIAKWFLHPRSEVSAHYIIGKDGELVQCVADEKRAWHAGPSRMGDREKINDFSIGIELVNAQTGHDPFTEAQYKTLAQLSAHLMSVYPIVHVVGHKDVTNRPWIKKDPAPNFDWGRYRNDVSRLLRNDRFATLR